MAVNEPKKFEFDISKIEFDGVYVNELEMVSLYFIAPKDLLLEKFPEAVSAEIKLEYPLNCHSINGVSVEMSPTRQTEDGGYEDYEWFAIVLLYSDIEALLKLANKTTPIMESFDFD